jgi:hypothetical protein
MNPWIDVLGLLLIASCLAMSVFVEIPRIKKAFSEHKQGKNNAY